MKRICLWVVVAAFVLSLAVVAVGAEKECAESKAKPTAFSVDVVTLKATVTKIDKENRILTIQGPRGNTVEVTVGESAKNFDQIEEGDKVVARYVEALAVHVEKAEGAPVALEATSVEVAPRGHKPGRYLADTVVVTAKVLAADYKKRILKLETPSGDKVSIKVGKEVKKLNQIKKGDEVVVKYTKTLALTVEKP